MQEIVNTLGNLVALITEFFSFIAPGYFVMILTVFLAFLPWVIFSLIAKAVREHA